MSKRANGEGTIYKAPYKTKTGKERTRWIGQYYDKDGKRKPVTGKSEQEVKDKLEIIKEQLRTGRYVSAQLTLGDWLKKWFYDFILGSKLKPNTIESYESIIRIHFLPDKIAKIRLTNFEPEDLQDFYNRKQQPKLVTLKSGITKEKKGLADKYIANIHAMLHQALAMAVTKHYAYVNVCEQIKSPTVPKKRIETFSIVELNKIIQSAKEMENGNIILLDILTGMRIGEMLALKWKDIDLETGEVIIKHTIGKTKQIDENYTFEKAMNNELPKKRVVNITSVKTDNSDRETYIDGTLLETLREIKNTTPYNSDDDFIFCDSFGNYIPYENIRRDYEQILENAGVKYRKPHTLRHTFGTLGVKKNVDYKTMARLMGHSGVQVFMDLYVHPDKEMKKNGLNQITGDLVI